MTTCKKCHGDGLIGAGDQPWLKHGTVSTCDACNGTGKVSDDAQETVAETPEVVPEVPVEDAPVDNAPAPEEGFVQVPVDAE